jgi:hypothetical protein
MGGIGRARVRRRSAAQSQALLALALAASLASPSSVGAQVLLLPLEQEERIPDTSPVADAAATTGTSLRSHDAAREALVATHGEDPPQMSESDLARWVASSRQAVRSLARADYEGARSALAQAEAVTDRALAELNREAARARQVLDTCLYLVRSLEETGQHSRAVEQGYACRRLVPRGTPTVTQHPPEVRAVLDEVDRALAAMPGARLRVVSDPPGCAVRLNGLDFGTTPLLTEDLRAGEYRVQVECDGERRGRVHRVELGRTGAELRVDGSTEAILGTTPLRIVASRVDAMTVPRIARIGRIAGAREVWVVEAGAGAAEVFTLHRIDAAGGRELAVVRADQGTLPLALASLRQGRSHDWTTDRQLETAGEVEAESPPVEVSLGVHVLDPEPAVRADASAPRSAPEPAPSPASTGSDHLAENVVGALAIALGAGAYGTAWALWEDRRARLGERLAVAEPLDLDYLARQRAWLDAQIPVWALGGAGAALWTVAVPLVLGPDDGVPWWSWVLGGVGVAGVGAGVAVAATAAPCSSQVELDGECVDAAARLDVGWLVITHAAPFLAFPVTHLVRSASQGVVAEARIELGPGGGWVGIGGTL